jgi:hypothetical protein
MQNQLPSLVTRDARSGLTLATELAEQLYRQIETAGTKVEHPGGMNYLLPAPIPKEIIASVLYFTIAAANNGWAVTN